MTHLYISLATVGINFVILLACLLVLRSSKAAATAAMESTKREIFDLPKISGDASDLHLDLEFVDIVKIAAAHRAKFPVCNMQQLPIKMRSAKLYKYINGKPKKGSSVVQWIKGRKKVVRKDGYLQLDGALWNPQGPFDEKEYFQRDAARFAYVKDCEFILITIPDYQQHGDYMFELHTSAGTLAMPIGRMNSRVNFAYETNVNIYSE